MIDFVLSLQAMETPDAAGVAFDSDISWCNCRGGDSDISWCGC